MLALLIILINVAMIILVGGGIQKIRAFDRDREMLTYNKDRRYAVRSDYDGVFDRMDDTIAVTLFGTLWPIGILSLLWHLNKVEWTKEQRQIMKALKKESFDSTTAALQEKLDKKREANMRRLEDLAGVKRG